MMQLKQAYNLFEIKNKKYIKKITEMHGGKSVRNSLALPGTVKVGAPPS